MNYKRKTKSELIHLLHMKDAELIEINGIVSLMEKKDEKNLNKIGLLNIENKQCNNIVEALEKTVIRLSIEETIRRANCS